MSCTATLASSPAGAPTGLGTLGASAAAFLWQAATGTSPTLISFQSIQKLQQSPKDKPGCKLRVLLNAGGAYVFDIGGSDPHAGRDALVEAFNKFVAANAAPSGGTSSAAAPAPAPAASQASSASAPASGGAVPAGNVHTALLAADSHAQRKGRAIAAAGTDGAGADKAAAHGSAPGAAPSSVSILTAALSAVSSSVFTPADLATLKRRCLEGDVDLAAKYTTVVASGMLTDGDFWEAHLDALIDAATAKPRRGLPSMMPDELQADETAQGRQRFRLDNSRKVTIFVKEPRVHDAFLLYVPLRLSEKEFWERYLGAVRDRKQLERADGVPRVGRDMAVAALEPADFFELYRRGEIDPTGGAAGEGSGGGAGAGGRAGGGTSAAASAVSGVLADGTRKRGTQGGHSKAGLGALDPTFDLLSSAEERVRGAGRDAEARGGYGTGAAAAVYSLDRRELERPSGGAGAAADDSTADAVLRAQRLTERYMREVNRYSGIVVSEMGEPGAATAAGSSGSSGTAGAVGAGRSGAPIPSAAARRSAAVAASSVGVEEGEGSGLSAIDDLPDLYAPSGQGATSVPLRVDLRRLRAGMEAQGEGEGEGIGEAGSAGAAQSSGGSAAAGGGGAARMDIDGPAASSAGTDSHEGQGNSVGGLNGGWSAVGAVHSGSKRPRSAAGDSHETDASASFGRPSASSAQAAPASQPLGVEGILTLFATRPAAADILGGKPVSAAVKRLAREQCSRAHDLFASKRRTKAGFSRSVPVEWTAFVSSKFRALKEILLHFWNTRGAVLAAAAARTAPARDASSAAALRERLLRLQQRIEREYEELQGHKEQVLALGPVAYKPAAGGGAGPASGAAGSAGHADLFGGAGGGLRPEALVQLKAEVVELLNMLQIPLDQAIRQGSAVPSAWA